MPDGIQVTADITIVDVESKERNRRSDGRPFRLWEITTQDGTKWATMEPQLGGMAMANITGQGKLTGSIKNNGSFTNYYVESLIITVPGHAKGEPPQTSGPAVTFDTYAAHADAATSRKDESIHRQVAAKVAVQLVTNESSPSDFWANVDDLFNYFQTGDTPFARPVTSDVVLPETSVTSHTPDPGRIDGFQHADDDIPY